MRATRVLGGVLIGLALLLVVAVVLTRTALCKVWLLPTIGGALGVRVEADSARVEAGGTVVLEGATFILPGVAGPAGRFLTVQRLEVDPDFGRSGVPISRIRMDGAVLRVSQAVDSDTVNLQAWNLPSPGGGSGSGGAGGGGAGGRRTTPPRIDLRSATIELGEHEGETFRVLKRMVVRGAVVPETGTEAWAIDLREVDPLESGRGVEGGMAVSGRLDDDGLHMEMTRASLADWPASEVPRRYRDVFELLGLEGDITRTYLELPWDGQVEAGIVLRDVAMSLPFEGRNGCVDEGGELAPLRLTRSGGTVAFVGSGVRATLDGWLEDLPYAVRLEYQGLTAESAFRCEMTTTGYALSERPRLLPFMPREVMERLADFRSPTGLVDASVVVERGAPVATADGLVPSETVFSGTIHVTQGRAAFHVFPYPFEQMEATVTFDQDAVRIERITGVSASGARLVASGLVTPLGDEAEVTIRVAVTGAPVDDAMHAAMGEGRRELLEAIFSRERLSVLESAGLVLSPGRRDELMGERDRLGRELADLSRTPGGEARQRAREVRRSLVEVERGLRAPVFELAGLADVNVLVHRERGLGNHWSSVVEVDLPRAGVLARHFPLPVEATDVRFVIRDRALELERGRFEALGGGEASVQVRALMPGKDEEAEPFEPDVRIAARGVAFDELLAHAMTHAGELGEGTAWGRGLARAELGGRVDADARVLLREDGSLGFDVDARFERARAATSTKPDAPDRIALSIGGGTLVASERRVDVAFDAQAQTLAQALTPEGQGTVSPAGRFRVEARIDLAAGLEGEAVGEGAGGYRVSVDGQDVVSDAPVERLVGLISPEVEAILAQWRVEYEPRGRVSGIVTVEGTLGQDAARVGVSVREAEGASVRLEAGRVGVSEMTGTIEMTMPTAGRAGSLVASGFGARMWLDGVEQGRLGLDGEAELVVEGERGLGTGAMDLRVSLEGARLESLLTRAALGAFAPDRGQNVAEFDPSGVFDATLAVARASSEAAATFEAEVRPRSLGMLLDGERLTFESVEGVLTLTGAGGQGRGLRASGADYSLGGDVDWTHFADGQTAVEARFWGDAPSLSPAVRSLLPEGVRLALEQIGARGDGAISLSDAVVHASWRPGQEASVEASGLVRATDVSADVGVELAQGRGSVRFAARGGPERAAWFDLSIALDRVRAAGLMLSDVRARVHSGEREGEVVAPLLQGEAYGGRIAGSGRMVRARREGSPLQYDMTLQASGVRFASLLEDREEGGGEAAGVVDAGSGGPADASRGLLAAEVSLGGIVGDDASRRGRGSIQLGGGTVVALPLLMPIIEVSNLRLPASTPLDVAFAEFFVLGDRVTFEDMSAFTRTVEIWGYGTMDFTSQRLDMRFNTRSTAPIPVVSELIEGVRNELISTRVRGTLGEPDVGTIQFSGTRTIIDTLLGDGPDEQQRRLAEIGERAQLNRTRALRAGERLRWLVASQMEGQAPAQEP